MLKHINNVVRENSQTTGNVSFARLEGGGGGGREGEGLHKNVSQILAIINFSSREITGKALSASKNIIGNVTLSQTNRLNLGKFGVDIYIPDFWSAPFA